VTGGVYVVLRTSGELEGLKEVGLITILITGSMGSRTRDIKRIIALSTGGQMGYIVMGMGMGLGGESLMHIIVHGVLKGMIFILVGIAIVR
jgi:NADH:ubiquinone oxidoreductase subunit 5 (subunit L)/multisubunit Na+/H+ antiporter MnhA subunit